MYRLSLFAVILLCLKVNAQVDFKPPSIASPNVSSLLKFGEIPVSYFSGIPNISIPIFQLNEGDISLPITIDYHASGIKVEEVASSVGLGWSLNAGGLIGVEVRGLPDNGSVNNGPLIKSLVENSIINYCLLTNQTGRNASNYYGMYSKLSWANELLDESIVPPNDKSYFYEIREGSLDGESDIYFLNLPGISCKFFKNNGSEYYTFPHNNILIQWDQVNSQWIIIDSQGIKYKFFESEICHPDNSPMPQTNAWWIKEIEDTHGEKVSFYYSSYSSHSYSVTQSGYSYRGSSGVFQHPNNSMLLIHDHSFMGAQKLDSITSTSGTVVKFYSSKSREDQEHEFILDSILVKNSKSKFNIRTILSHSYFNGLPYVRYSFEDQVFPKSDASKRLKLDNITINDKIYQFGYDETPLPSRYSLDQDLWGYYNEAGNNYFFPYYFEQFSDGTYISINGGNRTVNPAVNQAGVLNQITYPTGGNTKFEYETNEIMDELLNGIPATITLQENDQAPIAAVPNCTTQNFFTAPFNYILGSTPLSFEFSNILNDPPNWDEYIYIDLVDAATSGSVYQQTLFSPISGQIPIPPSNQPPPGWYKLKMCHGLGPNSFYIQCHIKWNSPTQSLNNSIVNVKIGGLRIKSILKTSEDQSSQQVTNYKYCLLENPGYSSGSIINYPVNYRDYYTIRTANTPAFIGGGCFMEVTGEAHYKMLTSYSTIPIGLNNQSIIGYNTVTEEFGEGGDYGKTVYHYSDANSDPDIKLDPIFDWPNTPNSSLNWNRGLLLDKENYRNEKGNFILTDSLINYYSKYSFWEDQEKRRVNIRAIKKYEITPFAIPPCQPVDVSNNTFWRPYVTVSGWNNLDSTIVKTFDGPNSVKEITRKAYTDLNLFPDLLLIMKSKDCSNGDEIIERYKYPSQFNNLATGNDYGIKKLQDAHIIDRLVESSIYIRKNGSSTPKLIESTFLSYNSGNGKPLTDYKIDNGQPLTNFVPSYSSSGNVFKDSRYVPKQTFDYDIHGNLLQTHRENDITTSYEYGYNNHYPISEVKNATSKECAYTGFENHSFNDWLLQSSTFDFISDISNVKAGRLSIKISNNRLKKMMKVGLNANDHSGYKASVWVKGSTDAYLKIGIEGQSTSVIINNSGDNSEWHLLEIELPNVKLPYITENLTLIPEIGCSSSDVYFDDLRFYPMDAQMITCNYDPLIGIISVSDINNRPTKYEYNAFGRLVLVRDYLGEILKKYEYNYEN